MKEIIQPTSCPSCESTLEVVNSQLFCRNTECPAQNEKKLQNFCKKLKLKGFGESTLAKLEITNINDLVDLTVEFAESKGFSKHMATKLVNVVSSRIEDGITYNDFIAACSIPMIGDGAMRKLQFDKVENITYELCRECGIGDKAAKNLLDWIEKEWYNYKNCWTFSHNPVIKEETKTNKGVSVCITGKLDNFKNRSEASNYLESLGFEVKGSVTKKVDYLICEDGTTGSSYKKAQSYGIEILKIKDLEEKFK